MGFAFRSTHPTSYELREAKVPNPKSVLSVSPWRTEIGACRAPRRSAGIDQHPQRLFDYLVSEGKDRRRKGEADRLRSVQVHSEFETGGLVNWDVPRLSAVQDLVQVVGELSRKLSGIVGVRHQPAVLGIYGVGIDRWQAVLLHPLGNKAGMHPERRFRTEQQRVGAVARELGEAMLDL